MPFYYTARAFRQFFGLGVEFHGTYSSSPDVEALASATKILLVNERPTPLVVDVDGTLVTLAGYEVRLMDYPDAPAPALLP